MLPAHDAEIISSSKAQYRLGNLVNRVRYDRYIRRISGTAPRDDTPAGHGRPKQGKGEERFAKARQRSQSGPGATAFLRARPVDSPRVIPASEFVSAGRRVLGMEEFLQRGAPAVVQRTQTHGTHDCVIDRVPRSTGTSPWSTHSPAPLSGCRPATRWKAELLSTPTRIFEWTW